MLRQVPSNVILYFRSVLPCTRPPAGIYPEGQSVHWAPGGRWLSSEQEGELSCGNDSFFLFQDQFSTLNKWNHTVISFHVSQSFFFFFLNNVIYLFIYGCAGSSMSLRLFSSCGARASHCGGFSCCGTRAQGCGLQQLWLPASRAQSSACGAWASLL